MNFLKRFSKLVEGYLTFLQGSLKISKTRERETYSDREMEKKGERGNKGKRGKLISESLKCPYCLSTEFVRRGFRKKKLERVQLYLCKTCNKTFTSHITKGKHYPLKAVLEGISLYNLGYSLEESCRILNRSAANSSTSEVKSTDTSEVKISASTLANWIREFEDLCKFSRMREFAIKKYSPQEMVIYATLAHQQLFRYRFHRAKCRLMIEEDFKHRKFWPLKEFLEMVPVECPHQYFQEGLRASEAPMTFSKRQMIVRSKTNYANRLCKFVLQSVKERKRRHEALQKFMLYNDSVTVATEVPVYLTKDDLEHLQTQLGFEMYPKEINPKSEIRNPKQIQNSNDQNSKQFENSRLPKLITGHIDILQIRNGQIHILDYKPKAEKGQPIEQLTLYAMALSRLTGLRLFEFKCAWFDENEFFEFYPLHVIHKPKSRRRRKKIRTIEGVYKINLNPKKIEILKPIKKWLHG